MYIKNLKTIQMKMNAFENISNFKINSPVHDEEQKVPNLKIDELTSFDLNNKNKVISIETLITCLTTNPRNRFNIENSLINEGEKANLTLFNPDFEYEFSLNNITSTSKNSVFLNKKLNGKVYGVISNNKVVL